MQQLHAAFGRGDVPAILSHLADDVEWENGAFPSPVPWLQPRHGKAGAGAFFAALTDLAFHVFEPQHLMGDARTAIGVVRVEATVRASGKRVEEVGEVHLFHFNEQGVVQRFRHACDTWQWARALRAD